MTVHDRSSSVDAWAVHWMAEFLTALDDETPPEGGARPRRGGIRHAAHPHPRHCGSGARGRACNAIGRTATPVVHQTFACTPLGPL